MRSLCMCLLVGLSLAGCSKKQPAPPEPGTTEQARPAAAVPAAAKIDCEKLLPKGVREKYFPGGTMKQEPMCAGCPEHCKVSGAKPPPATVIVDCRGGDMPQWLERTTALWEKSGYKKASGAGRVAYSNAMQFIFVPQKHNCYVTITWFGGGEKLLQLASDIDQGITPAAIGK